MGRCNNRCGCGGFGNFGCGGRRNNNCNSGNSSDCRRRRSSDGFDGRSGEGCFGTRERTGQRFDRSDGFNPVFGCNQGADTVNAVPVMPIARPQCPPPCPPPCPKPCPRPWQPTPLFEATNYGKYNISNATFTLGNPLPLTLDYTGTMRYNLASGTTLTLPAGYIYEINYIVQATLPTGTVFSVIPLLNGTLDSRLETFGVNSTAGTQEVSASGSFTIEATPFTTTTLALGTTSTVAAGTTVPVTGSLSIHAVEKIANFYQGQQI